ncbi:hypothetical protein JKP88DRAFT_273136 [Tribonema minus]|uniref:Uncharacterized protein n=1 Tax=Tribonema minus TaxID=303371 RepID=A0A835Z4U3_9STRA|nr:hypothetical protein JKP88DRAFT_273136 [Tribonema minus]
MSRYTRSSTRGMVSIFVPPDVAIAWRQLLEADPDTAAVKMQIGHQGLVSMSEPQGEARGQQVKAMTDQLQAAVKAMTEAQADAPARDAALHTKIDALVTRFNTMADGFDAMSTRATAAPSDAETAEVRGVVGRVVVSITSALTHVVSAINCKCSASLDASAASFKAANDLVVKSTAERAADAAATLAEAKVKAALNQLRAGLQTDVAAFRIVIGDYMKRSVATNSSLSASAQANARETIVRNEATNHLVAAVLKAQVTVRDLSSVALCSALRVSQEAGRTGAKPTPSGDARPVARRQLAAAVGTQGAAPAIANDDLPWRRKRPASSLGDSDAAAHAPAKRPAHVSTASAGDSAIPPRPFIRVPWHIDADTGAAPAALTCK